MFRVVAGILLAAVAATAARAETRTFRDWRADCDARDCVGSVIAGAGALASSTLRLKRAGQAGADWELMFALSAELPDDAKIRLSVDGQAGPVLEPSDYSVGPEGVAVIAPSVLRGLVPVLREAATLSLAIEPRDGRTAEFSLSGMAATMLWIDERQGRVEAPSAAPAPQNASIPDDVRRLVDAESECAERPEGNNDVEMFSLDEGRTLIIAPCWAAAYNFGALLAVKSGGEAQTLAFPTFSKETGWTAVRVLVNASYDARTRTLTSFYKGRGLGDCGALSRWRWSGNGFTLLKIQAEDECRGRTPDAWPVVYEAR